MSASVQSIIAALEHIAPPQLALLASKVVRRIRTAPDVPTKIAPPPRFAVQLRKETPAIGRGQRGDARGFGYGRHEIAELDKRF